MKILIGSWLFPLKGGSTNVILDYTKGLTHMGHKVGIISPAEKKYIPEHFPVTSSYSVELISNIFDIEMKAFSAIKAKREIVRFSSDFCPDIYWNHSIGPIEDPFEKNMMLSDKPKIVSVHSFGNELAKIYTKNMISRIKEKLYIEEDKALLTMENKIEEKIGQLIEKRTKRALQKADAVVVPTSEAEKRVKKMLPQKPVYVIPCGVSTPISVYRKKDLEKEFHELKDKKILLYVGRLSCEKNVELLIEALYEASKERDDLSLLIIGPGDKQDLLMKADLFGVKHKVVFAGPRDQEETAKYYGGADLFLFASETETQGIVIWEAMVCGLPVVAFDLPISLDIYPPGTAFTVNRKDGVNGFSKAILVAISDDKKRNIISENGRNFAKTHTKENCIIEVEKVLKDVLY